MEETTANEKRYRLRSSLKKSSKDPFDNLDVSDEVQDVTLAPPARRVSFAASSTIKRFADDPEKNTIWDNTYEEEINNHTDSNVMSLDLHSNIHGNKGDFNQTAANIEETLCNSMEITKCKRMESINITNVADKENIYIAKGIVKSTKSVLKKSKPLENKSLLMKTVNEPADMEMTCQYSTKNIFQVREIENDKEDYDIMEVDETNKSLCASKYSIYQEMDMSMTCKFSNSVIDKENAIPSSLKVEKNKPQCVQTFPEESLADMEFTGTFSRKHITQNPDLYSTTVNNTMNNMEFTCQFPSKAVEEPNMTKASPTDMEFTCRFPPSSIVSTTNVNQGADNMEFTCQFPSKSVTEQVFQEPDLTSKASPVDMEFTYGFPRKDPVMSHFNHFDPPTDDMEFTCQFPSKSTIEQVLQKTDTSSKASPVDMEFTCRFPQNTPISNIANVSQAAHSVPNANEEQFETDMSFTCQFLSDGTNLNVPKQNQTVTDMSFTCRFPPIELEAATNLEDSKKIQSSQSLQHNSLITSIHQTMPGAATINKDSKKADCFKSLQYNSVKSNSSQFSLKEVKPDSLEMSLKSKTSQSKNIAVLGTASDSIQTSSQRSFSASQMEVITANKSNVDIELLQRKVGLTNSESIKAESGTTNEHSILIELPQKDVKLTKKSTTFSAGSITCSKTELSNSVNPTVNNFQEKDSHVENGNIQVMEQPNNFLFPKPSLQTVSANIKVKEFGSIPIAIDCTDLSIEQSFKDEDKLHLNVKSTYKGVNVVPNVSVKSPEKNILDSTSVKDAIQSVKESLYQYFDQSNEHARAFNFKSIEGSPNATSGLQKVDIGLSQLGETKEDFLYETIGAQECSLVDSLLSLNEEDLQHQNATPPPKVIYSEPMKVSKPSTSILDFSMPSSGKKTLCVNSINSMDGTQQLLQATFSKHHFSKLGESGLEEIDNSVVKVPRLSNQLTSFSMSINTFQKILNRIESRIVEYKRPQIDFEAFAGLLYENQVLQEEVRVYLEQFQSPKPRRSRIDEKVRRLSLANNSLNNTNSNDSLLEYSDEISTSRGNISRARPKTLHQRIMGIFDNTEDRLLKLEYNAENHYIFSIFSRTAFFSVELHPEDGRVTEIKDVSTLKQTSNAIWPNLHALVVQLIRDKLQMSNLRCSLGTCFDMLSLLDHVNLIVERGFEFCIEFINTRRTYKTLNVSDSCAVSFQIMQTDPVAWWTIEFKMASMENIQPDSLIFTSKYHTVNEEHLSAILRNAPPGNECIRSFIDDVLAYFKRIVIGRNKIKDHH